MPWSIPACASSTPFRRARMRQSTIRLPRCMAAMPRPLSSSISFRAPRQAKLGGVMASRDSNKVNNKMVLRAAVAALCGLAALPAFADDEALAKQVEALRAAIAEQRAQIDAQNKLLEAQQAQLDAMTKQLAQSKPASPDVP